VSGLAQRGEGLLAMSVGLGVLHELLGGRGRRGRGPEGKHIACRTAVQHGHAAGEVTLGGRRVPVSRPRVRGADGEREVELQTYAHFAARDRHSDVMLAGVSTRRYARMGEPVGEEMNEIARSTRKSAVRREFVSRTRENQLNGAETGSPKLTTGGQVTIGSAFRPSTPCRVDASVSVIEGRVSLLL
jgi:hypothetical protein